jgi:hypothetical protein
MCVYIYIYIYIYIQTHTHKGTERQSSNTSFDKTRRSQVTAVLSFVELVVFIQLFFFSFLQFYDPNRNKRQQLASACCTVKRGHVTGSTILLVFTHRWISQSVTSSACVRACVRACVCVCVCVSVLLWYFAVIGSKTKIHANEMHISFRILMAVNMLTLVFCVVTPCELAGGYQCFRGTSTSKISWFFNFQGSTWRWSRYFCSKQ